MTEGSQGRSDGSTGAMTEVTTHDRGLAAPEPASGDAAHGVTLDASDRLPDSNRPRWGTTSWWGVIIASEIATLVALGYMAYGQRYPFLLQTRPVMPGLSLETVTRFETIGRGILAAVLIGLVLLLGRWWWRLGLAMGLVVVLAVTLVLFEWGTEDKRLSRYVAVPEESFSHGTSTAWAANTCRRQFPTAAEEAFARGRVPDECRDIWLGSYLGFYLNREARAALEALGAAQEAAARALDENDQVALMAWVSAKGTGSRDLEDTTQQFITAALDDIDNMALELLVDADLLFSDRLEPADWDGVNRYLSIYARPMETPFDTFLDAMGFRLNAAEVDALLEALKMAPFFEPGDVGLGDTLREMYYSRALNP